jgi:hypothetical protein
MHEKYNGNDRVHTANGNGMQISHIGQSILCTPHDSLQLKDVLYVPTASKNLLSIHKLTLDNNAFMEFHPWFFLIKDRDTRRVLGEGPCSGGLYPFSSTPTGSSKQALSQ